MKKVLSVFIISLVLALMWTGVRIYKSYDFSINCSGHLKRAADANTVETAKKELNTSLVYMENKGLTTGVVSIFLHQPKNDIGFWYENIKASRDELENITPNASQLEKTNVLMKLRETLLDSGEKSDSITCPNGITVYPMNVLFFLWGWISWIMTWVFGFWLMVLEGY